MDTRREVREIFLRKVRKTDHCWEWTGSVHNTGYGMFYFDGSRVLAHRFSYLIFKGEIPEGHQIRHTCDNRTCVRPDHMLTGTHKDNARDAQERKRHRPWNAEKARCPRGHSYEKRYGQRICRTCRVEATRQWRARRGHS